MTNQPSPHGWLIVDKPSGVSSTQLGNRLRRLLGAKSLGHLGTLDPMASGVLPLALGEATKTVHLLENADKSYRFRVIWGELRDTGDATGQIIAEGGARPTVAQIESVLPAFIGSIWQVPPAYSAIKINGQRAYDLARAGEVPNLKARNIFISNLQRVAHDETGDTFAVDCSKGTYVRSLAIDIAAALNTYGYVDILRRTRVGAWHESHAILCDSAPEILYSACVSIPQALNGILVLELSLADAVAVRQHGRSVYVSAGAARDCVLAMHCDTPIALGAIHAQPEGFVFKPHRVFCLFDAA